MAKESIAPISIRPPYLIFDGAWHLVYYIPSRWKSEPLSNSLIKFKENDVKIVDKWISQAIPLIESLGIEFHYIIRALGSKELEASGNKPLDKLGEAIAKKMNCHYVPECIKKNRLTEPMHSFRKKHERQSELEGVYYYDKKLRLDDDSNFLILDDINTTGSTVKAIRKEIQAAYPNSHIFFFTLGRTGAKDEEGEYITTLNSNFDSSFLQ